MKKLMTALLFMTAFMRTALADWKPLPPTTDYWQELLHLGASFNNDMLPSFNFDSGKIDWLAHFGNPAETDQAPYDGLIYSVPNRINNAALDPSNAAPVPVRWTAMVNPAKTPADPNPLWKTNPDCNNYIKYWHIYLYVPGSETRSVRFHYRCDDNLYLWQNGEPTLSRINWDNNAVLTYDSTLTPGVNSILIKLREGDSGDHMVIRLTDANNAPFSDILYSLNGAHEPLGAPAVVSRTDASARIASTYFNPFDTPVSFYAFCAEADADAGDTLDAWISAVAQGAAQELSDLNAMDIPTSYEFVGLNAETEYCVRFFAKRGAIETCSEPITFITYNDEPVVAALPASDIAGLSFTANVDLIFAGAGISAADLYLYWGATPGTDVPASWNGATSPIHISNCVADEYSIPVFGLDYEHEYHYRVLASNATETAWSPETISVSTIGSPVFGSIYAEVPANGSMKMTAEIETAGPAPATITCYWGDSLGTLAPVTNWLNQTGAPTLSFTKTGLQVGGTYYYAFSIYCYVNSNTEWTVFSATNTFVTVGSTTWTAGAGADTDWTAAANWDINLVPGGAATAVVPAPGFAITAAQDAEVSDLIFSGGSTSLNLGNKTISASQSIVVGAPSSAAHVTLENGALTTPNETTIGIANIGSTFTLGANSRLDTRILNVGLTTAASDSRSTRLIVGDGGVLSASGQTTIAARDLNHSAPDHELHVLSGGLFLANGIALGADHSNSDMTGRLIIDGGTVTNAGALRLSQSFGREHAVHLRNGAYLHQTGLVTVGERAASSRLVLVDSAADIFNNFNLNNFSDNAEGRNMFILTNSIVNLTGTLFVGEKQTASDNFIIIHADAGKESHLNMPSSTLGLGRSAPNNRIHVNNGALTASALHLGNSSTSLNNQLRVADAAKVRLATMNLNNQAVIGFAIPRDGFTEVPIILTGAATLAGNTRIEIDAGDFTGTTRLMETAAMPILPDENFTLKANGVRLYKIMMTAESLDIKVSLPGSLLIIK